MTIPSPSEYIDCATQIAVAHSILTLSLPTVKALFNDKEMSEVIDFYQGEEMIWLEVKFDLFVLTGLFNKDRICKGAFLDDLKEIESYIDYCTQTYLYDTTLNGWIVEDCCITVDAESEEFSLAILPIPTQPITC